MKFPDVAVWEFLFAQAIGSTRAVSDLVQLWNSRSRGDGLLRLLTFRGAVLSGERQLYLAEYAGGLQHHPLRPEGVAMLFDLFGNCEKSYLPHAELDGGDIPTASFLSDHVTVGSSGRTARGCFHRLYRLEARRFLSCFRYSVRIAAISLRLAKPLGSKMVSDFPLITSCMLHHATDSKAQSEI